MTARPEITGKRAAARQRLAAGQASLTRAWIPLRRAGGPMPMTASRMGCLLDALSDACDVGAAAGSARDERTRLGGACGRTSQQVRPALRGPQEILQVLPALGGIGRVVVAAPEPADVKGGI